jgi:UDP-N-acetylglucosamine--dolichyl-phosphate N-acetylglucosaminephosphotransferase
MNVSNSALFVMLFLFIAIISIIFTSFWIRIARKAGLIAKDIHKFKEKFVPEIGGITILLSFIIGVMSYIAIRVFILNANTNVSFIFATLTAILLAGFIGVIDDILGWKIGLKQWQKPLLTLLVAAPIIAVNAGTRIMSFPLIGNIDLGLIYPLIIIPCFIMVGANGFNMLAGYNGLEAGQGVILLSTLAYFSYINGTSWITVIALCMVFSLLGFLVFNRCPAKVFPGDTLTYSVGALFAVLAILANLEKIFLILFIPYIIEFFLKLRGRFKKESFARVQEDGTLIPRYKKIYGLENLMVLILNKLKIKTTERRVVHSIYLIQLIFVALTFII